MLFFGCLGHRFLNTLDTTHSNIHQQQTGWKRPQGFRLYLSTNFETRYLLSSCSNCSIDKKFQCLPQFMLKVASSVFRNRWPGQKQQRSPKVNELLSTEEIICTTGVNFTNIIRAAFSYESFAQSFFVLIFKVCTFLAQKYRRKSCL